MNAFGLSTVPGDRLCPMTPLILLFLALVSSLQAAGLEYRAMGANIFDPQVFGEELVVKAINQATQENKRVLLVSGANECLGPPAACRPHQRYLRAGAAKGNIRARVRRRKHPKR